MILLINIQNIARDKPAVRNACLFSGFRRLCDDIFRNIKSGSGAPNKTKVATITKAEVQKIAELKMPDLNAASVDAAISMIAGTARSMGITVVD